jgi:hypothetical protein
LGAIGAVGVIGAVLVTSRTAHAEGAPLHWDLGAELGVEKRFLRDRPPVGSGDASFGPTFRGTAHLALLPLLRVGLYGSLGLSPVIDASTRFQWAAGADIRILPPLPFMMRDVRPFLFVGVGYLRTSTPSFVARVPEGEVRTSGASGGCLDIPAGLGATYRVRKPFELGATLGTRFAAFCGGETYRDAPTYAVPNVPDSRFVVRASPGKDIFALSLGVIANFEF